MERGSRPVCVAQAGLFARRVDGVWTVLLDDGAGGQDPRLAGANERDKEAMKETNTFQRLDFNTSVGG